MTTFSRVVRLSRFLAWRLVISLWFIGTGLPIKAATYIVFRYDDFSADMPGVRERDQQRRELWEAEQTMDGLFASHNLPYVVGVIPKADAPFDRDTAKVSFVKQGVDAGRIQVAMHGFTHANYAKFNGRASEFNRGFDLQRADVTSGLALLKASLQIDRVTTFIPPFNDWNESTAQALVATGFRILSADRYRHSASADQLTIVPFTAQLWELESCLGNGALPDGSIVVVLLHPAQIANVRNYDGRFFGLVRLRALLDRISTLPGTRVMTLDQLTCQNLDLSATRYAAAARLWCWRSLWEKLLPESWRPGTDGSILYLPASAYKSLNSLWLAITAAAVFGIIAASALVGHLILAKRSLAIAGVFLAISSISVLAGLFLVEDLIHRGFHLNGLRLFPVCAAFGLFSSSVFRFFRLRKHRDPIAGTP